MSARRLRRQAPHDELRLGAPAPSRRRDRLLLRDGDRNRRPARRLAPRALGGRRGRARARPPRRPRRRRRDRARARLGPLAGGGDSAQPRRRLDLRVIAAAPRVAAPGGGPGGARRSSRAVSPRVRHPRHRWARRYRRSSATVRRWPRTSSPRQRPSRSSCSWSGARTSPSALVHVLAGLARPDHAPRVPRDPEDHDGDDEADDGVDDLCAEADRDRAHHHPE